MKKKQWLVVLAVLLLSVGLTLAREPAGAGEKNVRIAVAPREGIQILSENPVSVAPDGTAVFEIQIQEGYEFSSVSAGEYEAGVLTVPASGLGRTVYVNVLKECGITLRAEGRGEAELVSEGRVMQGQTVSVRLFPEENYVPGTVTVNGTDYPAPAGDLFTFSVEDDSLVQVSFQGRNVEFMMVSGNLGSAVVRNMSDSFRYGDTLELFCEYDSECTLFEGWSVGGYLADGGQLISTEPESSYTLTGDTILYANLRDRSTYTLRYDCNGGEAGELPVQEYAAGAYVNTLLADGGITRNGWTLLGFHTEPECTGEPITPGGMLQMPRSDLTLYAQWVENTPAEYLLYSLDGGNASIHGFSAQGLEAAPERLVIPEKIQGSQVTQIDTQAFAGLDFLKTVVLPTGLRALNYGCFAECENLQRVYFPETITFLSPWAFQDCDAFSEMRVIASLPRVFDYAYDSAFADKYMRLTHAEGKRIILFGGSNLAFGINSAMIQEAFPDYTVVNMGVSIHYGILTQFDIARAHVREGDIVIFCPEYGFFVYTATAPPAFTNWQYLESNYDILQDIDLRRNDYLLGQFMDYLKTKVEYLPEKKFDGNYTYSRAGMNSYGDLVTHRDPMVEYDFKAPDMSFLTQEGIDRYNALFRELTERGALCCFTFPANPAGDTSVSEMDAALEPFLTKLTQFMDSRYVTIISKMSDCFIPGFVFYDSTYHMTLEGADIRTERLVADLKAFLEEQK